jgi:hypothetical protein
MWPGEEPASEQDLLALLRLCPDDALKAWPVGNKSVTFATPARP